MKNNDEYNAKVLSLINELKLKIIKQRRKMLLVEKIKKCGTS